MNNSIFQKHKDLIILLSLFLLGSIIRIIHLDARDIALDEPFTLFYAQQSIESIFQMLYNENNPPLHFIFMHYWIKIFGLDPFSVRLPSLLFSSLTIALIYSIGKRFFGRPIGIFASLIMCLSSMHIFFSHEARVYPLFCLLTASSLYFFLSIIENPLNRKNYIALFLVNLLLIYSHYFGFFVIFIEGISIFILKERWTLLKKFLVLFIGLAISYTPILLIFFHRLGTSTSQGTWVAKPGITEVYGNLNRFLNNRYNMAILIIVFIISVLLLIRNKILNEKIKGLFLNKFFIITFLWFIVPYVLMFIVSFKYPMFIDRYILYTSIPFFLTIAVIIFHIQIKPLTGYILCSIFLISMIFTVQINPDNNRRLKEVADITRKLKKERTTVFLAPDYAYMGFSYHYDLDQFKQAPRTLELLNQDNIFPVSDTIGVQNAVKNKALLAEDCIYIQAGTEFTDPQDLILKYISSKYKNSKVTHVFEIYNIYYFNN